MKILLISGSFAGMQCGVGDYTANIATAFARKGADVSVLTSCHFKISEEKEKYVNTNVKILDEIRSWNFYALFIIKKFVRMVKPDLIHIQYQTGTFDRKPWVNFLPIFLRRYHTVVTFHDTHLPCLLRMLPTKIRKMLLLPLVIWSDHAIVSNSRDKNTLLALWPTTDHKLSEIPIGTTITSGYPLSSSLKKIDHFMRVTNKKEYLLTCYGFIRDDRDYALLLRTCKELIEEGFSIRLIFLGGIAQHQIYQEIITFATSIGILEKIFFTGYLPSPLALQILKKSHIVVLPFKHGVSMARSTLVTALANGLPTVATSSGNLPAYIIDRQNIMLVPPDDPQALTAVLRELILSKDLRKKIASGALNISYKFSPDTIASRHLEIYKQVIA